MQPSMEVRWFMVGDMPATVESWFRRGYVAPADALIDDETRDDIYLSLPTTLDLGIKLRAKDRIEVKQRRVDLGVEQLRDDISGRLEQWVKWSFPLLKVDDKGNEVKPPDVALPPGSWITVKKRRLLRKFEVRPDGAVTAVSAKSRPGQGCNLEVAWLTIDGMTWWSLGFESFGETVDVVENILRLVLKEVLADPAFPTMQAHDSYAFPTWLDAMLGGK